MNTKSIIFDDPHRTIDELDAAQSYLFRPIPVIGRSKRYAKVIEKLSLPMLPLLKDNQQMRKELEISRSRMKRIKRSLAARVESFFNSIHVAIEQEKQKHFFVPNVLHMMQWPRPGEPIDPNPLTRKELKQLYQSA